MLMGEWHYLSPPFLIGLILSFLIARLISALILSLRPSHSPHPPIETDTVSPTKHQNLDSDAYVSNLQFENKTLLGEIGNHNETSDYDDDDDDDDDDWEGVESTELDEAFSAATAFVAARAADWLSLGVSNEVQLQLYGYYKIATEGPCTTPQPSAFKMTARAKWNAWQRLGAVPPGEAMQKYISIVNDLCPTWASGATTKQKGLVWGTDDPSSTTKGPMGPVFSTFIHEEESENELKMDAIHDAAREGDELAMLGFIANGVSVNLRDSEGRTPLHWAVDRGHLNVVELLNSKNADLNSQDHEGQTPLHYAAVCEREAIAELLVKRKADLFIKDNDGNTPSDLCDSPWEWMSAAK